MGIDAVEQILAESARFDLLLQVAIGRREHARIDRDRAVPTHTRHLPFLQHTKQFGLRSGRQVTDLVQEQRAPRRRLECTFPHAGRSGERAAFVPEQLALDQVLRQRRAVDRQKRTRAGLAQPMQLPRNQLFPRTALAHNQDGTRNGGQPGDARPELLHRPAPAHQRRLLAHAPSQRGNLVTKSLAFQGVLDLADDALHRLRLIDEPIGPQPYRLNAPVVAAGPRVYDDRSPDALLPDRPQHVESIHTRHL